ncbi:LacI family DNA-binding transcriptional regulator [Coraliomargarita sp. SDUM461004]|uniref:LacI family DNA-binding transcriptional regulator n=1 Tax=Thalassobacterium sedimentorum TaxID=3041258 RepID=A0ABU1AEU8_9BACT|nr:LacI family DNA-binding transcriptional regulator [Coraliomargarita sp. SDUM461004]MDQ8193310.1 LacI family DNA-binding transcriptional regulator [Coraliomargarita sp. SDUM461004]
MPRPPHPASLSSVARAAGVSSMTVSRVFRGEQNVAESTRRQVIAKAQELGYQPNPHISRLMEVVRNNRTQQLRAVLAVIRDDGSNDKPQGAVHNYVSIEHIRAKAELHGYGAEEFVLGSNGMTAERLGGILKARGVDGILISPQSLSCFAAKIDYSSFSSIVFGYGLISPQLHRASTNMTQGILEATERLEKRGYQRIGIAVTEWVNSRADHTYSGAVLHYQQALPQQRRVPLLLLQNKLAQQDEETFCNWIQQHKPDAIISFHAPVPYWLQHKLNLRIPEDIGVVVHDWMPGMEAYAGIDHQRAHVAAAAVDLVATKLKHNERGIPPVPQQILIPPRFVDGPSIRP